MAAAILITTGIYFWQGNSGGKLIKGGKLKQPNVIIILIDSLRSDHLSMNGYGRQTSPNLAALAEDSVVFPHVTMNGSWTLPNVTTMFTGLHPAEHDVQFPDQKQDLTHLETLPEILKANGYQTSLISSNDWIAKQNSFDQGIDYYYGQSPGKDLDYEYAGPLLNRSLSWLLQQTRIHPLFTYVHIMNVHGPYRVPEFSRAYVDEMNGTFEYYGQIMDDIMRRHKTEARAQVTDQYLNDLTNQYDSAIYYTDAEIGRYLNALREEDIYDDSIVIIAVDHGEELYDHEGFAHAYSLYEEISNTMLMIKPHAGAPEEVADLVGQRFEYAGEQIDFLPTLLSLLDIEVPEDAVGQNLLNPAEHERRPVLMRAQWGGRLTGAAILDWPWKLIYTESNYEGLRNDWKLFNLVEDPDEQDDLSLVYPDRLESMKQTMDELQ
ncbi:sulfatase [Patescibacteria group bacterium]